MITVKKHNIVEELMKRTATVTSYSSFCIFCENQFYCIFKKMDKELSVIMIHPFQLPLHHHFCCRQQIFQVHDLVEAAVRVF